MPCRYTHTSHIWLQGSVQKAVLFLAPTQTPTILTQTSPPPSASALPSLKTTWAGVSRQTPPEHTHPSSLRHQSIFSPSCLARVPAQSLGPICPSSSPLLASPGWSSVAVVPQLITGQREKVLLSLLHLSSFPFFLLRWAYRHNLSVSIRCDEDGFWLIKIIGIFWMITM